MEATGHDNRGTPEEPFGFVYFGDDQRVQYSCLHGIESYQGRGWKYTNAKHLIAARAYLANAFPGVQF